MLFRRPFEVGEAFHVSDPNNDTDGAGSGWWMVKNVTLFTTTAVYVRTNELATLNNGALATSRIINASRSEHPCVSVSIMLPIDLPYAKLQIFKDAIEQYIRNRPREWVGLSAIRATNVDASQGFVQYSIVSLQRKEGFGRWMLR